MRAYHLPGLEEQIAKESLAYGDVEVEIARLRPSQLRAAMHAARRAGQQVRPRGVDEVLATIDRVVVNWLRPDSAVRRLAEDILPPVTGFSMEMVRHGVPRLLAPLRAGALRELLDAELGDRRVLDQVCNGRRAIGPGLVTHVLSGNIPGLAAFPIGLSLAVKSPVLIKSAAGDPIFAALFAASISEVDAELGACVLAAHWRGGDPALEEVAFGEADVVAASGSDAAIAAIAARVPRRFIGHGHKIGFAAIARECLGDVPAARSLARRLACDICIWDQQGCLSPQLCYIEQEGRITPLQFAELLAQELSRYATELPPSRLSLEEQTQVLRFRQEARWHAQGRVAVLASADSTAWSITIEPDTTFVPTCLHRCVRLKTVASLSLLATALAPQRRHLEGAGIAVGAERLSELVEMLAACGVHRICAIGKMQEPLLSWRQGGRPRVADWVEWTGAQEVLG